MNTYMKNTLTELRLGNILFSFDIFFGYPFSNDHPFDNVLLSVLYSLYWTLIVKYKIIYILILNYDRNYFKTYYTIEKFIISVLIIMVPFLMQVGIEKRGFTNVHYAKILEINTDPWKLTFINKRFSSRIFFFFVVPSRIIFTSKFLSIIKKKRNENFWGRKLSEWKKTRD